MTVTLSELNQNVINFKSYVNVKMIHENESVSELINEIEITYEEKITPKAVQKEKHCNSFLDFCNKYGNFFLI